MTQGGWFIGGDPVLPDLKVYKQSTGGQVIPVFEVELESSQGYAVYWVEYFDAFLTGDWSVNAPRKARVWLEVLEVPEECKVTGGISGAWSFESVGINRTQVKYNVRDSEFFAVVMFVGGEFVVGHQAI